MHELQHGKRVPKRPFQVLKFWRGVGCYAFLRPLRVEQDRFHVIWCSYGSTVAQNVLTAQGTIMLRATKGPSTLPTLVKPGEHSPQVVW